MPARHSLKSLREAAGYSQEELGRLALNTTERVRQVRICQYENGSKRMPITVANQIVKVLNRRFRALKLPTRALMEHMIHETHREEPVAKPARKRAAADRTRGAERR